MIVSFLFQVALPVLAQAASTSVDDRQLSFCTLQGNKFISPAIALVDALVDDSGEAPDVTSSTQMCAFCLLSQMLQCALPVAGGLGPLAGQQYQPWFAASRIDLYSRARFTLTPIRAPPRA